MMNVNETDRLIKANELLMYVGNRLGFSVSKTDLMQAVELQPTVDAVEVKHGKWIDYSTTMMECSVCKRHTSRHKYEYCPHCGAKMDAVTTEDTGVETMED